MRFDARDFGDTPLPGGTSASIPGIQIYVGPARDVEVVSDASPDAIGGDAFPTQPVLRIRDAGGNTVVEDSTSMVVATLTTNPTQTTFNSRDHAYALAERGIVSFSNLGIRAAGDQYAVTYTLFDYSSSREEYSRTSIVRVSNLIDVRPGPAASLDVVTFPAEAIAGGSAFGTQPALALRDRGGNALAWTSVAESSYDVEADIVPSLGASWIGVLETGSGEGASVTKVAAKPVGETNPTLPGEPGCVGGLPTLAAGDTIDVEVTFDFDVIAHADRGVPEMTLNVLNASNHYATAHCISLGYWSATQKFRYVVADGDASSKLDALSGVSIDDNGGPFWDPYYREVNATMPWGPAKKHSLSNSTPFAVDTRAPTAKNVSLSSPSTPGAYAPGTTLIFNVTFSHAVDVVVGSGAGAGVYLPVLIAPSSPSPSPTRDPTPQPTVTPGSTLRNATRNPTPAPIDWGDVSYAAYARGTGTTVLEFEYLTLPGQDTGGNPVRIPHIWNGSSTQLYLPGGARIYRRSSTPTTVASKHLNHSSVEAAQISIDNTAPAVNASYGARALTPDGTYYAGDELRLAVGFDAAVDLIERAPPVLYIDVGYRVSAFYASGAGTKELVFSYTIGEGDFSERLDLFSADALDFSGVGGYLRKASDAPSVDADLSLATVRYSLYNSSRIKVDGRAPAVVSYGIYNRTRSPQNSYGSIRDGVRNGNTTVLDDVVTLFFAFDKKVAVFGSPTIAVDAYDPTLVSGNPERVATYASGNETETIYFEYAPKLGDETPRLGITCSYAEVVQGFQDSAFGGAGRVMLFSERPTVDANTRLYPSGRAGIVVSWTLLRPLREDGASSPTRQKISGSYGRDRSAPAQVPRAPGGPVPGEPAGVRGVVECAQGERDAVHAGRGDDVAADFREARRVRDVRRRRRRPGHLRRRRPVFNPRHVHGRGRLRDAAAVFVSQHGRRGALHVGRGHGHVFVYVLHRRG